MMKIFAQTDLGTITGTGLKDIGNVSGLSGQGAMDKITGAISSVVGIMTIVAAIWFFITFVTGGIAWITAGGDKQKLTQARDKLTNAFIGLVIVVAGWAVLALAGAFFGWDILNPTVDVIQFK